MTTPFLLPSYQEQQPSQSLPSSRNIIINGAMVVNQRGVSAVAAGYAVDRWYTNSFSFDGIQVQFSQSVFSESPPGFYQYLGAFTTNASSAGEYDDISIHQGIEGYNLIPLGYGTNNQKNSYLSFWVKSSTPGKYSISIVAENQLAYFNQSYTIDLADTWEKKTLLIPPPDEGMTAQWVTPPPNAKAAILRFNIVTGSYFTTESSAFDGNPPEAPEPIENGWNQYVVYSGPGTANPFSTIDGYFSLTGIQWEVGNSPTEFEHRSYGEELRMCQRYFYKTSHGSSLSTIIALGQATSSTQANAFFNFPVEMRHPPTMTPIVTVNSLRLTSSTGGTLTCTQEPVQTTSATKTVGTARFTVASGLVAGNAVQVWSFDENNTLTWSSEF